MNRAWITAAALTCGCLFALGCETESDRPEAVAPMTEEEPSGPVPHGAPVEPADSPPPTNGTTTPAPSGTTSEPGTQPQTPADQPAGNKPAVREEKATDLPESGE